MRYVLIVYIAFTALTRMSAADPVLVSSARDTVFSCETPSLDIKLTLWYEAAGGAEATEPDGGAILYVGTPSLEATLLAFEESAACGGSKTVTVSFMAVGPQGDAIDVGTAIFASVDETNPTITQLPSVISYQCQEGIQDTLIHWIQTRGGASAVDNCSAVTWTNFIWNDTEGNSGIGNIELGPYPMLLGSCQYTYNMSFIVLDDCDNQRATTGSFTIIDDSPPVLSLSNDTMTVSCDNIPEIGDISVLDFCDPEVSLTHTEETSQIGSASDCSYYNYLISRYYTAVDACGNTARDTLYIHVADLGPPIVNGTDTLTISCEDFNNGDTILITAIDDCSQVAISVLDSPYTPACHTTVDRVYTIRDICGNEITYDQHIIIDDNNPPTFVSSPIDKALVCTDNMDIDTEFSLWLTANLSIAVVDGCTGTTVFAAVPDSYDPDDSATFPGDAVGGLDDVVCPSTREGYYRSEEVDFVVYDPCGNISVQKAIFGVVDDAAPMIVSCFQNIEQSVNQNTCVADISLGILEINDDCGQLDGTILSLSNGYSQILDLSTTITIEGLAQGFYTAMVTTSDCAGNTSVCSFEISIVDEQSPVITSCIEDITISLEDDNCTFVYDMPHSIIATDNCFLEHKYQRKLPFQTSNEFLTFSILGQDTFVNNKAYTFGDVFEIKYTEDAVKLEVNIVADIDEAGENFTVFGENGYQIGITGIGQACEANLFTFDIPVSVFNTWVADDQIDISLIANNGANAINPCSTLRADGTDRTTKMYVSMTYSDALVQYDISGVTAVSKTMLRDTSKHTLNAGENIVTYYVADESGNDTLCTYTIDITDETPPIARCKNAVIQISPDGEETFTLDPSMIDDGSEDLCGAIALEVSPSVFSCDQVGSEVEVTLIVTDVSGNKDSCTSTIKVEPFDLSPSFSAGICQDDTLRIFANAPDPITPNAYTYSWEGPNFSSTDASPFIINADGDNNGLYSVTVTGFNGCMTTGTVVVDIAPLTTPEITVSSDTVCVGDDLVMNTTSFTGNVLYEWYEGSFPSGVLLQNTTTPSLIISPTEGQHFYYVIAQSTNCVSNASPVISIAGVEIPEAVVNDNFINICEEESFSLGTSSFGAGYTYIWTGPNGFSSIKPLPEEITEVSQLHAGEYSLIISVGSCLSDTAISRVNIFEKPTTPIITSGETFCEGSTVSLTVNNVPNVDLYTWYLDGVLYTTDSDNSLVIPNAQANISGSWQVSVMDGMCASDTSDIQNINIEDLQDISVTNSGPACEGDSIQLFVSFIAGASYNWSGPEDFTSQLQNPKILATTGEYTVEIVTGTNCEVSASTSVVVNTAPVITALSNNSTPCMDGETNIVFFPTIVPADPSFTYEWTGPNGFTSDMLNPVLVNPTELQNGTYSLSVINDNCNSEPVETTVDIKIIPEQPLIILPNDFCIGDDITLISNISQDGYIYIWNTPNTTTETDTPELILPAVDNTDEGEYSLTISIDECQSMESDPVTLTLSPPPTPPSFTTNAPLCVGDSLVLTISNPVEDDEYLWEGPTGVIGTGERLVIQNIAGVQAGEYRVLVKRNGCLSEFSTGQIVDVMDQLTVPIPQFTSYDICEGITTNIEICLTEASATPGATYYLFNINTQTTIATGGSICFLIEDLSILDQGSNFLNIQAEKDGCLSQQSAQIRVELSTIPNISADILEEDQQICDTEDINLNAKNGPPLVDISWSSPDMEIDFSNTNTQSTTISNLMDGDNEIILGYSQKACIDYDRDTIIITIPSTPETNDDTFTTLFSEPIELNILNNDELPEAYSLSVVQNPQAGSVTIDGDQVVTYNPDNRITGLISFVYEVCVTDCDNLCDQATVTIQVGGDNDCLAPTIITPNDDNINDRFVVPCLSGNSFPDSELIIFNQWGDEVYSSDNYDNSWAGTYDGKTLSAGTYFYILDIGDGREPIHSFLIIQL